jgi:hypothetical protein
MDRIVVGLCSERDSEVVVSLLKRFGIANSEVELTSDCEVREGLELFCSVKGIRMLFFLQKSLLDKTSNQLTLEISQSYRDGKDSRLDALTREIELSTMEKDVWIIFAHNWCRGDEISCYSGSAEDLRRYMLLNHGAFRLVYVVAQDQYNIDLDTPLAWNLPTKSNG